MPQSYGRTFCNARHHQPGDPWYAPDHEDGYVDRKTNESRYLTGLIGFLRGARGTLYLPTGPYAIEPAGAVVVDQRAASVFEVGCREVQGGFVFWEFDPMVTSGDPYRPIAETPGGATGRPTWLHRL